MQVLLFVCLFPRIKQTNTKKQQEKSARTTIPSSGCNIEENVCKHTLLTYKDIDGPAGKDSSIKFNVNWTRLFQRCLWLVKGYQKAGDWE